MAVVKLSRELLFDLLKDDLLLPNPINSLDVGYGSRLPCCPTVEIQTHIEGFETFEIAVPIYHRDENGTVSLLRIGRPGIQ